MRRNGILKAIVGKYLPYAVTDDDMKPPNSLGLQKTVPVFALYLGGIFMSIACLLIELQAHRLRLPHRASFIN
jgi:hypothetical protein